MDLVPWQMFATFASHVGLLRVLPDLWSTVLLALLFSSNKDGVPVTEDQHLIIIS